MIPHCVPWAEKARKSAFSATNSTKCHALSGTYGALSVSNQRFISTFAGTLDGKGRVCIPATWRQTLTSGDATTVYVCASFESESLIGFGQEMMDAELKRLDEYDPVLSGLHDDLAATLVSGSMQLSVDGNGRVSLPAEMIEAAGLTDRVVFVGVGRKFEIWNPDVYAGVRAQRLANAKAERAARAAQEAASRRAVQAAADAQSPASQDEPGTP